MAVAVAVPQAVVVAEQEAPECYICMEPETALMPFLTRPMCACSSKATSTLKVHQLCLELARDQTGKCAVCKTPLNGDWAFDQTFRRHLQYGGGKAVFTQIDGGLKHGAEYTLRRLGGYVGSLRYLAAKGQYRANQLHGPQFVYQADGSASSETNYVDGVLHGLRVERNAKGAVELEENYENGFLHGLRSELYFGIQLTGNYVNGAKEGTHLEGVSKAHHIYSEKVPSRFVNRATYEAGRLDGPYMQYHIDCGEALPTETAVYKNGLLNGLQEKWTLDVEKLERKQTLEAHWLDGKRNGRYAEFYDGELNAETFYFADQKHGVDRLFNGGKLQSETTWHMGTKHGRVREWTRDHKLLFDANYDNGFRHGRFVSEKQDYYSPARTFTEDFWSDGTKELRHGIFRVEIGGKEFVYSEYKMGVRHGAYRNTDSEGNPVQRLNFRDGKLHGKCMIYDQGILVAGGHFKNGVSIDEHIIMNEFGKIRELVHFDDEGQLHGVCLYNNQDGSPHQRLNFKHGVLHGRQVHYADGRESRVFNMRDGAIIGRFTLYDARGAIVEQIVFKKDDAATLEDVLGPNAICYPSERQADGTFKYRYVSATGDIFKCKAASLGDECDCEECYVPPARKPIDDEECMCGYCRRWEEDERNSDDYTDERDYEDERGYDSDDYPRGNYDSDDEHRWRRYGRRYYD
jgi:antitoxin component YwqK of YwqJK toxin-antitoxin module